MSKLEIADCFIKDYVHLLELKNFCLEHGMRVSENKADLLKQVIEYAGEDETSSCYKETYSWFLNVIKAGSKEFCIKRIYVPEESVECLEKIIEEKYSPYHKKDILSFKSSEKFLLVNYRIEKNKYGVASKVSFVFSRLVLEGDKESERGHRIVYPVYIDLYLEKGFIVGRYKPKTIIYTCSENDIIYKENRVKCLDETIGLIQKLEKYLRAESMDINPEQRFGAMMYKMYQKYSFTPTDIQTQVDLMKEQRDMFVNSVFNTLGLNTINKTKAKMDLDIFLEKFVSINGDREKIFKEDREAYLIKISSDDFLQMTRIDTTSTGNRPLQCSETFFDSKKSILNTKECKNLNLCYNRKRGYLGFFTVQFSISKGWGIVKMYYVPEEEDIENVLQTIFENY